MRYLIVYSMFLYGCLGALLYYDAYHGAPINSTEIRRRDTANLTIWCTIGFEKCEPNEGRRIDGSCNNLQNPTRGARLTPFYRVLPPIYDKDYEPRKSKSGGPLPLARVLRTRLLSEGRVPSLRFTQLALHFLLFMAGDIVSNQDTVAFVLFVPYCCTERGRIDRQCAPNQIPDDDPVHRFSNIRCTNMTRPLSFQAVGCLSNATTPERISTVTPLMDLSAIYGSTRNNQQLRTYQRGLIKFEVSNGRVWPPSTKTPINVCLLNQYPRETRCHNTPEDSTNALAGSNLMSIWIWRMHNKIATELAAINPCWGDQKLFDTARDLNIAFALQMLYYELFPLFLGIDNMVADGVITPTLDFRDIYNPKVLPQVSLEYPYVLRWFHTMQEGSMKMYDSQGYYIREFPIVNATLRTGLFDVDNNIDYFTQGSFRQASAASDYIIDPDIGELGLGGLQRALDLGTNDVAKARYFGFQPYIKYRELCFGKPISRWNDLVGIIDLERIEILKNIYEDIKDIDLLSGIYAEKSIRGGHVPSTLYCLVIDQLIRNMVSDRHWFERPDRPNAFTFLQLREVRKMTVARLMCDVGDTVTEIQPQAFLRAGNKNRIQSCNFIAKIDYSAWRDQTCSPNVQRKIYY